MTTLFSASRRGSIYPGLIAFLLCITLPGIAQQKLPLTDLSFFKAPPSNWQVVGDAWADLQQANTLNTKAGTGILVNQVSATKHGSDIYSNEEFGDIDLELDYMMAKGSNSGLYLQGRYELQLLDSWGVANPRAVDNGAIYDRNPPRQNVSRAPGLWQHLKISFQAPRFDAGGKKISPATMLRVELNGVLIHENVTITSPTGGAMSNEETARGPFRIQGDHGTVAFRNIVITSFDKQQPSLSGIDYKVYAGKFETTTDFTKLIANESGKISQLSGNMVQLKNGFLVRYNGSINIKEAGDYNFKLGTPGGSGAMKINYKDVIAPGKSEGKSNLPAGTFPFEIEYGKYQDWAQSAIGLFISGPGIREFEAGDASGSADETDDPILVNASTNTLLHSFMDIPGKRLVHAVSVGSPIQLHYTYDQEKACLVQVWRGGFLDATPMWHERGDGSSRPIGSLVPLGNSVFFLQKLSSTQQAWSTDSAGTSFRSKGYRLDKENRPAFNYQLYGTAVTDAIVVLDNAQGFKREITVKAPVQDLYAQLAKGKNIELLPGGLYSIDDKNYYIQVTDAGGAQPVIRTVNGQQELLLPVKDKIIYSILF